MKLKYYMRGLGIGILLTTLILALSYKDISENEIIRQAMELGMVWKEDPKGNLDEVYTNLDSTQDNKGSEKNNTVDPESEDPTDNIDASETDSSGGNTDQEEGAKEGDTDPVKDAAGEESMKEGDADPVKDAAVDESTNEGETDSVKDTEDDGNIKAEEGVAVEELNSVTLIIERGMSSEQVANALEYAGLVEDARDFNHYIVDTGNSTILRVGTYHLSPGLSYKEIIEAITK